MEAKRIVITGIGVLSALGVGKVAFFEAMARGLSGIKPISLFDTSGFSCKNAGEISNFLPETILGPKGLRTLDRSTKLVLAASKLALDDAGVNIDESNTHNTGVAIGTTLGSISSICDFDKEAILEGPHYVNPALFPNTVINSPASQVSIRFNIKGFNVTVSTGFCASLDAIGYAADALRLGRAEMVLAGGVEELCIQTFLGFYKLGCLADLSCPFDKRHNGVVLGEGSSVLVLETLDSARKRQAHIYAELGGHAAAFETSGVNNYSRRGEGLREAMSSALINSKITAQDIDYISAAANSTPEADELEAEAIKDVFGTFAPDVPVGALKSMVGECFSASGSLQVTAAVAAIEKQIIPPTINFREGALNCQLRHVANQSLAYPVDNVLVNGFGPSGCNSSLVISKLRPLK